MQRHEREKIYQRSQVIKSYNTETHKHNNTFTREGNHVHFKSKPSIDTYQKQNNPPMVTYNSGADELYLSKKDRTKLGLPILRTPDKKVGLANGGAYNGKCITSLTFPQLSSKGTEADTSEELPTSLISMGKKADDGNMSIFTKYGVTIHKEEDVILIFQEKPILVS